MDALLFLGQWLVFFILAFLIFYILSNHGSVKP
ncbi:hypothetical protein BH10CHL1_BH10CHL1_29820 [soil metagenome]